MLPRKKPPQPDDVDPIPEMDNRKESHFFRESEFGQDGVTDGIQGGKDREEYEERYVTSYAPTERLL